MKAFFPRLYAGYSAGWFVKDSLTLLASDRQANAVSSRPPDPALAIDRDAQTHGDLLAEDSPRHLELRLGPIIVFDRFLVYLRHFEWTPPDGVPVSHLQRYDVENGCDDAVTATSTSATVDDHEDTLPSVLPDLEDVT